MKILVAGGGIAGLTCAIALAHRGHAITVLERRAAGPTEGAGVILWPSAVRQLAALGLVDAILPRAAVLPGLVRRGLDGAVREAFDFHGDGAAPAPLAIRRAHLVDVLQAGARRLGATLVFDAAVTDVPDAGGPDRDAVLACADGRRWRADLVIGAEGRMNAVVGHRVRGLVRVDHGLVSWVGWARGLGGRLGPVAVDLWGDAARFGIVPCGDGEVYWAATVREDRVDTALPWRTTVGTAVPDTGGLVHAVLAASEDRHVNSHRLFDLEPGGPWCEGRLVLVGDAAHAGLPTTGRGASEAMRDAEVLAAVLPPDAAYGPLQRGLARYVAAREPDACEGVRQARAVSVRIFGDTRRRA